MNEAVLGGFYQDDQRFGATVGIHYVTFVLNCVGPKKGG